MDQLKCKVTSLEEECSLLRKQASTMPQRETEERGHPDAVSELWAENQRLTASLQELQGMLQVPQGQNGLGWQGALYPSGPSRDTQSGVPRAMSRWVLKVSKHQ